MYHQFSRFKGNFSFIVFFFFNSFIFLALRQKIIGNFEVKTLVTVDYGTVMILKLAAKKR